MYTVAIDTSIIEHMNFDFKGTTFTALRNAVAAGLVEVLVVDVVDREVRKHVKTLAREAANTLRKNYLLAATGLFDYWGVRETVTGDAVEKSIIARWEEMLAEPGVSVISVATVNPSLVMEAYFGGRAPFPPVKAPGDPRKTAKPSQPTNDGLQKKRKRRRKSGPDDKKKHEFPDAFIIERLRLVALETGQPVYVVADDHDFKVACDGRSLIYVPRLTEILARLESDELLTQEVAAYLEENQSGIAGWITELFEDLGVSVQDDPAAEPEEVRVLSVVVQDHEIIDHQERIVQIEVAVAVRFELDARIRDYASATYDEGDLVFIDEFLVTFKDTAQVRAVISLELEGMPQKVVDYVHVVIEEPSQIEVGLGMTQHDRHIDPWDEYEPPPDT